MHNESIIVKQNAAQQMFDLDYVVFIIIGGQNLIVIEI